jgi:hypothetical protein
MAKATVPKARPDLDAYETSIRLSLPEVVTRLNEILSPKLVAYIAEVSETRAVKDWATGERTPKTDVEPRLRTALRIALFLADHDSRGVVQAWFQGLNPQLNDVSPARLLRSEPAEDAGPAALAAARAFVVGG